jgi:Ca2+-binding EF-hand superfamily protein
MASIKWKKKAILGIIVGTALATAGTVYAHSSESWDHKGANYHGMGHSRGGSGDHMNRMFDKFDVDKDGKASLREVEDGLKKRFAAANANGDDKLTLDEFQTLWMEFARPRMVRHFQHIDSQGKGYLTQEALLEPILRKMSSLDRDKDGAVSKDELHPKRNWKHGGERQWSHGADTKNDGAR